jgi:hypothetical protein
VDSVGSGQGPVMGSCEHGSKPSGSGATQLVTGPASSGNRLLNLFH